jgi:hypothetical protein
MNARYLQTFLNQDVSLDDLILGKFALQNLIQGYKEVGTDVPEWVQIQMETVAEAITKLVVTTRKKKLRDLKNRRAAMATPDERRRILDEQIAELEKLN